MAPTTIVHKVAEAGDGDRLERGSKAVQVNEIQRRRLLAAMSEVAAADGVETATVGAVCRRAGVSRRTFYDLFEARQDCFLAAFEHALDCLADELSSVWGSEGSWRHRVRASLSFLLERFEGDPVLLRLCLVESLKGTAEALERRQQALETLVEKIDEGRAEAGSRARDLPELTAESVVGGVAGVLQARVLSAQEPDLSSLLNPLMSMIVQPYLGAGAARRERTRPRPERPARPRGTSPHKNSELLENLPIRVTFRTVRVIEEIGSRPGVNNREVALASGILDQGQTSKMLRRLERAELIQNFGAGQVRGEANAWRLTYLGQRLLETMGVSGES
jgi:AcrR family transcriptional regulator